MGDLFLHLPFARRLRFTEGLHPLAAEALVRRSPLVALGASLPALPLASLNSGGLLSKLFKRGKGEAQRWADMLTPRDGVPRPDLVLALGAGGAGAKPGPLNRLALALGALSHELLAAELEALYDGLDPSMRAAVERGQARLWLQFAVPTKRDLDHEWAPALAFHETDSFKPVIDHLDQAVKASVGQAPGRDTVVRWVRALFHEITPLLEKSGMPDPLALPDHTVRAKYFDGAAGFLDRAQAAATRFVYLSGRLAEQFLDQDPDAAQLREALCDEGGALRKAAASSELKEAEDRWRQAMAESREEARSRGRNPRAAYHDDASDLAASLPDLPPLPDDAEDSGSAPTVTQEVSLAQIEAEMRGEGDDSLARAPALTQEVSLAQIESEMAGEAGSKPPPPPETSGPDLQIPAHTQQVSLDEIESEVAVQQAGPDEPTESAPAAPATASAASPSTPAAPTPTPGPATPPTSAPPPAPAHTQQVAVADIESEVAQAGTPPAPPESTDTMPRAPAHTQQVSLADIESEVAGGGPPPAPRSTQQISASEIQAEVAAADVSPPPAPTSTQQLSAAEIQAEAAAEVPDASAAAPPTAAAAQSSPPVSAPSSPAASAAGGPPPAPLHTQQISSADIEAELAEASGDHADPAASLAAGDGAGAAESDSAEPDDAEPDAAEPDAAESENGEAVSPVAEESAKASEESSNPSGT